MLCERAMRLGAIRDYRLRLLKLVAMRNWGGADLHPVSALAVRRLQNIMITMGSISKNEYATS